MGAAGRVGDGGVGGVVRRRMGEGRKRGYSDGRKEGYMYGIEIGDTQGRVRLLPCSLGRVQERRMRIRKLRKETSIRSSTSQFPILLLTSLPACLLACLPACLLACLLPCLLSCGIFMPACLLACLLACLSCVRCVALAHTSKARKALNYIPVGTGRYVGM